MALWDTRAHRNELLLAGLRVLMGIVFLAVWADNLRKGFYSGSGWSEFVQDYADTTRFGFYEKLLNDFFIPNASLFAAGQLVVESVVFGLFLVIGLFTPVSALLAAGFQLNLLLATSGTGEWPGTYIIMLLLLVAIGLAQSGRTLGVDSLLARREPHPRVPVY